MRERKVTHRLRKFSSLLLMRPSADGFEPQYHNGPFATSNHVVQNPSCWRASSLLFSHWDIKPKRPEPVKLDMPLF